MMDLAIAVPMAWLRPGRIVTDVVVVCRSGVIQRVDVDGSHVDTGDLEIVALDGFLTPAGADRHVHVELGDPASLVRRGITAVRDLGWPEERIFPLAEISEAPGFDGPLIRGVGPMLTAPGGYPTQAEWAPAGTGLAIGDAAEATAAVERLAARGAAAIKVALNAEAGPTPGDAILAAICEAAHSHELLVTAHTQGPGEVARALGAGVDELAHTPWTERLSDDLIDTAAKRMRWVSTLDIHRFAADSPALRTAVDNLARFHRAGGTIVYGTDLGNGPIPSGIHTRELQLMHDAGLGTEEVLDALVRAPIEPGAPADLLVLGDSPLGDPSAFDDIRLVVKSGRVVAP